MMEDYCSRLNMGSYSISTNMGVKIYGATYEIKKNEIKPYD